MKNTNLNDVAKEIHKDCIEKGFYENKRELGTRLMLVVSELSEALEADRKNNHATIGSLLDYSNPEVFEKYIKDTFEDEIADTFIRLLDLVGYLDIDIDKHIQMKREYNKTRPYKHNKKY